MKKPFRCVISFTKLLGIILASIGFGMLFVLIIPWWDILLALGVFIAGLCLIFLNK